MEEDDLPNIDRCDFPDEPGDPGVPDDPGDPDDHVDPDDPPEPDSDSIVEQPSQQARGKRMCIIEIQNLHFH